MKFYNEMLTKLREGTPFKFSRWGDGEWGSMYGWTGMNRDSNRYLPELREELNRIIESEPDYFIGIQPGVFVEFGRGVSPLFRDFVFEKLFRLDLNLVIGDVLHYASQYGHLRKFTDALEDRTVHVMGQKYFEQLPYHHILTPEANSFYDNKNIFRQIEAIDVTGYNVNPVYLVASAMNSNVIIDKLPTDCTAIDIGSVFDPYLGYPRARYQRDMNVSLKDLYDDLE